MPIINQRAVSVTANTKFLASDIKSAVPDGWLVITIVPAAAGKLTVVHNDGTNEDDGILNNNTDLAAGAEYSFNVPCPTSATPSTNLVQETINFKFSATTTLTKLIIMEGA